ncbi:DUF6531 domain-containing protein, partial [Acidobacteriota bacterium]
NINHHYTNLVLAQDYWVDIDEDGRGGIDEDSDIEIDEEVIGQNITGKDETRDVVFFGIPTIRKLVVVDVTEIYYKEDASGKRIDEGRWQPGWSLDFTYVKDAQGYYAGNMREMQLGREDRVLYVTDINMGVMVLDAHLSGKKLFRNWETFIQGSSSDPGSNTTQGDEVVKIADLFSGFYGVQALSNPESWYLGDINTSGKSQFGLLIDEDLNMAVVGQQTKGVDVVKLAQPEITFVKKDENEFKFTEVRRMSPSGTREDDPNDNPLDYPDEVYLMALLPGGIAQNSADETIVYCDVWSLTGAHAPMIPWNNENEVKTYMKKVKLERQSDNPLDPWYKVFLSAPIRVTIDPYEERKIDYQDREGNSKMSELRILSGDIMWVHLGEDFLTDSGQGEYINPFEASKIGDKKPSIRAELIDRRENFDLKDVANLPADKKIEKPNSPALNPALYSNVLLHSGEFVWDDIDLRIPGRGFDFVFARTYRSQAIYSGVLGWGWDHNYNKRLLELHSGDILYYDGTGRRERFKAIKSGEKIIGYTPPKGWFVEFSRNQDGLFHLIYPDRTIESFDGAGRLVSISDRNLNKMEFFYNVSGQLSAVMDTMGRLINFEYEPFETEVIDESPTVKVKSCRLAAIRDFSDRLVTFKYDTKGDLVGVDFEGREKGYSYSQVDGIKYSHNLETITSAENKQELALNYIDDKVSIMNSGGLQGTQTHFTISELSPIVTLPKGNKRYFTLVDERIETIKEKPEGKATTFTYDEKDGLLQTVTYPENNRVTYNYEEGVDRLSAGNLVNMSETPDMIRGNNGNTREPTKFTYDSFNNQVTSISYPNGLKVENRDADEYGNFQTVKTSAPDYPELEPLEYQYQFNRFGQVKSERNFFGMETTYNYYSEETPGGSTQTVSARQLKDTGGYLKEIVSPLNTHNFVKYDERGNLVDYSNSMDVKGNYTTNKFDELQEEKIISSGSLSPMSYNASYKHYKDGTLDFHETTFSSGSGEVSRKTDYKYTPRSMLDYVDETITTPTASKTITTDYGYDLNDNLTAISSGVDSISFGYNDRDLVENVTIGSGDGATSVSYTYDGNGNVLTVTDHYGHQTVYTYDGYDRLMRVNDPLNNITLLTLFDKGNTLKIQRLDSTETLLRESIRIDDPLGRLQNYEVKLPGGQSETYQYTYTDGNKTITVTDSLNRSWTYKKNENGQVYYEVDPAGNFTNYYYEDAWGNITKKEEHEKLPGGTEKVHVTKYKYNSQGKIEEIRELLNEENPNEEDDEKDLITTFTYDTRANLIGTINAEGNKISHEYDGFDRKTLTTRYLKNGEDIKTSFTYYDNNLPKTITDDKDNVTEYKYDDQKRLTKVIYPDLSYIEITYTKITKDEQDYKRVIIK